MALNRIGKCNAQGRVLASLIAITFLNEQATIGLFTGTILIIGGILIIIYWPVMKSKNIWVKDIIDF